LAALAIVVLCKIFLFPYWDRKNKELFRQQEDECWNAGKVMYHGACNEWRHK
jgi:hypothetical protein